jgi:hypothetical protein
MSYRNNEDIVDRIHYKQALMTVISNFEEVLRENVNEEIGQLPQVIDVRDVDEVTRFGATGQVHLVTIDFSSEFGSHQTMLAIKFSSSGEKVFLEASNSRFLTKQLEYYNYGNLRTPKLLFAFPEERILIYEGIHGEPYYQADMATKKKAVLAGRLLGAIHGPTRRSVDAESYENLMALMLSDFPISSLRREAIGSASAIYFEEMKDSMGGGNIFGDYHQGNVILSLENRNTHLQKIYVIDAEYMMFADNCRCEDIANFFVFQIIEEYKATRSIDKTRSDLHFFLLGYNQILRDFNLSLKDLYPLNIPLEFHLAYHIFINIRMRIRRSKQKLKHSKKVNKSSIKNFIEEIKELISLAEFLLNERPLTS